MHATVDGRVNGILRPLSSEGSKDGARLRLLHVAAQSIPVRSFLRNDAVPLVDRYADEHAGEAMALRNVPLVMPAIPSR